jgi:hypothetical protein
LKILIGGHEVASRMSRFQGLSIDFGQAMPHHRDMPGRRRV